MTSTAREDSSAAATGERTGWTCIDADIHPTVVGGIAAVADYLSTAWRRRLSTVSLPVLRADSPIGVVRRDAAGPGGEPAASTPELVAADHLDRHEVEAALLVSLEAGRAAYLPGRREASTLVGAFNQHLVERWLRADSRLRLAITVAPRDPAAAVEEIRRWTDEPAVAAVYLPLLDLLMGDVHYYPIFEAAQEAGLPIYSHPGTAEGEWQGAPTLAGGPATSYALRRAMLPQVAQSNLASLVYEGVLERFTEVKFVFAEYGFSWVPHVLWRMDKDWRGLRPYFPWVKRPPIEYVVERVRFTSQPIEEPPDPEHFDQLLSMIHAEQTLMFSSDYPHWDNDFPRRTFGSLAPDLRRRLLYDNAAGTLRLSG
jgi:predicted TIM-barrel fold metal-dependent hydrolase